jgi:hypothetical protein
MEKIDLVYTFENEDFILEYPLEISIQGDFLLIYEKDFPLPIGKIEKSSVLLHKPVRGNKWDHSNIYLRKSDDCDLKYCREVLTRGALDEELRKIISTPDLEDYRVMANLSLGTPEFSAVLIDGNTKNINSGNPVVFEGLSIGDEIRFKNGSKARLSLYLSDKDSELPYNIVLTNVDLVMKVHSLAPNLEGVNQLDVRDSTKADYFIDINDQKEYIINNLKVRLELDGEEESSYEIIESLLDFSMDGLIYIPKSQIRMSDELKDLLPRPN